MSYVRHCRLISGSMPASSTIVARKSSVNCVYRLSFSASTASTPNEVRPSEREASILPLYERDPDRVRLPRAAFGISCLNTSYWLWYSLDFIPAVNASLVADLHIDPTIGYGALGLGIAINVVTALYPSLLVAKLDYDKTNNRLHLYRYNLPFVNVSSTPTVRKLGEIKIDTSDSALKMILQEYKGDWSRFKGHLALREKGRALPLLLEVQNGNEEVKNGGEDLLQIMLRPKSFLTSQSLDKKKTSSKAAASKRRKK